MINHGRQWDNALLLLASLLAAAPRALAQLAPDGERLTMVMQLEAKPQAANVFKLLPLLAADESDAVRLEAARVLGIAEHRTPAALDALSRAAQHDASDAVRRQAILSAVSFEGHPAVAAVLEALRSERNAKTRRDVADALATAPAHRKDSEATDALIALFTGDPSVIVRRALAKGLGPRGDQRAVAALTAASNDNDRRVRRAAKASLKQLARAAITKRPTKPGQAASANGRDPCDDATGWCECVSGPMRPRAACMARADCAHSYHNTYRPLGYTCTWDGQAP